jgi:hypothetical protein
MLAATVTSATCKLSAVQNDVTAYISYKYRAAIVQARA